MTIPKIVKQLLPKWNKPPYHVEFDIARYSNTREAGRGYPVVMRLIHKDDNGVPEETRHVSMCYDVRSAEMKVKELQDYADKQKNDEVI